MSEEPKTAEQLARELRDGIIHTYKVLRRELTGELLPTLESQILQTIKRATEPLEKEKAELKKRIAELEQTSGELCDKCGWRTRFPDELCRCEMEKRVNELEAEKSVCHHLHVYYNADANNYYCSECKRGMGAAYYSVATELTRLKAELAEALKVINATRDECKKFRFPDEDRPEIYTALVEFDAAMKKEGK